MMKRSLPALTLCLVLVLLSACTPGQTAPLTAAATDITPGSAPTALPGGEPAAASEPVTGEYHASDFLATSLLGRPTDTSITLNTVPAAAMEFYVEYGTAPGSYPDRTPLQTAAAGAPTETLIASLLPDTRYYYRIRYAGAAGPEGSFVTQRAADSTFTFDLIGDSHPERVGKQFDAGLFARTLASAAADQPDLFFTMGDDFSVDSLKQLDPEAVAQLYRDQRRNLGQVGAPVFLVNGNHEQAALANLDGTPDNVAVWAQNARNAYFSQPAPDGFYSGDSDPVEFIGQLRDYYAFTWGDALFVVIDPYWHSPQAVDNPLNAGRSSKGKRDLWQVTLGEAQYQWFRRTLETSSARYKFVFAHHVNGTGRGGIEAAGGFEWGDSAGLAAHRPGWESTIQQIMADAHVTIFFQGHDHLFARQQLDGVTYLTLPSPADPHYAMDNAKTYLSGDILPAGGHVRISVSPTGVGVEYVRSYLDRPDEVAYSMTLPAAPQATPAAQQPTGALPTPSTGGKQGNGPAPELDVPAHPLDVILARPTDHSITVSLMASAPRSLSISYGTTPGIYSAQTAPVSLAADTPQSVELAGLQADTLYYYAIDGVENTFHTARTPSSGFTFTIQADSHLDANTDPQVYLQTLSNQRADRPDFMVDLGDTFMTEKYDPYTAAETQYLAQRYYLGQAAQAAPLFLVLGNHDGEGAPRGKTSRDVSAWAAGMRTRFFPNPTPDGFYTGSAAGGSADYYSWTWGDALFIVLDPYGFTAPGGRTADPWDQTLGLEQYRWLESTLEGSRARWKFIFIHQLVGGKDANGRGGVSVAGLYEWGGRNADGTAGFDKHRPGWGLPIHPLLAAHQVTAVFHGHDHLFAQEELDGIIYQEVPQPGSARPDDTRSAGEYGYLAGSVLGGPGHVRVTVTADAVQVEYVRSYLPQDERPGHLNGQVDVSYTLH